MAETNITIPPSATTGLPQSKIPQGMTALNIGVTTPSLPTSNVSQQPAGGSQQTTGVYIPPPTDLHPPPPNVFPKGQASSSSTSSVTHPSIPPVPSDAPLKLPEATASTQTAPPPIVPPPPLTVWRVAEKHTTTQEPLQVPHPKVKQEASVSVQEQLKTGLESAAQDVQHLIERARAEVSNRAEPFLTKFEEKPELYGALAFIIFLLLVNIVISCRAAKRRCRRDDRYVSKV